MCCVVFLILTTSVGNSTSVFLSIFWVFVVVQNTAMLEKRSKEIHMASVIVAGATGAIGREFVIAGVSNPGIRRIVALSRRGFVSSSSIRFRSFLRNGSPPVNEMDTGESTDWNSRRMFSSDICRLSCCGTGSWMTKQ